MIAKHHRFAVLVTLILSVHQHYNATIYCACLHTRYATEVDVDFVRKSVRAIGRCAIKVETAAERCVGTLVELIQTKVTYVVQEAVVVIKVGITSSLP